MRGLRSHKPHDLAKKEKKGCRKKKKKTLMVTPQGEGAGVS